MAVTNTKFRRNDIYCNNACLPKAATGRDFSPLEVNKREGVSSVGTGGYVGLICAEPKALQLVSH